MTYYGITLNVGSLAGDLYMNLFLLTVVELISCAIPVCLLDTLGRKPPYVVCMVLGGLTCIGVILIRLYGGGKRSVNIGLDEEQKGNVARDPLPYALS